RKEIEQALSQIQTLQKAVNAKPSGAAAPPAAAELQQQISNERTSIESLEKRLDQLAADPQPIASTETSAKRSFESGHGAETTPGITSGLAPADIYKGGFFVETADKSFSVYMNGLFQTRFTWFKPGSSVARLGESPESTSNFDVYLGRLAFSGSAFSPTLKYFIQMQGSTVGNGNGITLLDWFTAKTFSKGLTLQVGRFWTPFTYEYYDSPANYLFADLSTAEFAFVLPRAIGFEAYGQEGKLSYAGVIANSIPALDAPGQENFNNRMSYIGNLHFDILAPYGYVETDPSKNAAPKPELTLWGSVAYNPIAGSSGLENVAAGDKTTDATATAGFRYTRFTLQTTGYFRRTNPLNLPNNDSWGYGEQAGFYLVPSRFEVAERVSGVNWGGIQFPPLAPVSSSSLAVSNGWYAGPTFPYHNITEHSVGLNYYLFGHNAKLQLSYSYLTGNTFSHSKFNANRIWVQTQIMY
ncbi:MAG: hypothetical protein KGM47_02045, partial [Acidobacteriota bacterium]|nr:hypothetical protein [Acidobacteriota bacterium]